MANYDVGDLVRLSATFKNSAGTVTDPTTVAVSIRLPSGTATTYTYAGGQVTKASTGVYTYDFSVTASGYHAVRWVGTGTVQAAEESSFVVQPSAFS